MMSVERARIIKQAATLIEKVKSQCQRRGANGFRGLARTFRIFDDNDNLLLDHQELKTGLADYGIELRHDEVELLMRAFDADGDGHINMNEFLMAIRGGLNPFRRRLILAAFNKFDHDRSGRINVDDLRGVYSADRHPLVLEGKKTVDEMLKEFLLCFDDVGCPDGVVHLCEFEAYYAGVSVNIDDDEYFELMIRNAWRLTEEDIRSVTEQQMNTITSFIREVTNTVPAPNIDTNTTYFTSEPPHIVDGASFSNTIPSKQFTKQISIPHRIVGYTGHVPGNAESFGESFHRVQEKAVVPAKRVFIPPPPTNLKSQPVMIKKVSRANAHSYRLE